MDNEFIEEHESEVKIMTVHGAQSDNDRLYLTREKGRPGTDQLLEMRSK